MIKKTLLAILIALFVVSTPLTAHATEYASTPVDVIQVAAPDKDVIEQWLPLNRWNGSGWAFHSRRDNWFDFSTMMSSTHRDVIGALMMSAGDFLYGASSSLVTNAASMSATDAASASMDRMAAKVGEAVMGTGGVGASFGVLFLVAIIASAFWSGRRLGIGHVAKTLALAMLVISLSASMVVGASQSTGGVNPATGKVDSAYVPGKLSPGWYIQALDDTISVIAGAPMNAVIEAVSVSQTEGIGALDVSDCRRVIDKMHVRYLKEAGSAGNTAAAMPVMMSILWEQSGLTAWKYAQFGPNHNESPRDSLMEHSSCHLLEMLSDKTASQHVELLTNAGLQVQPKTSALAFTQTHNNSVDAATIGWAACGMSASGQMRATNKGLFEKDGGDVSKACSTWWNDKEPDRNLLTDLAEVSGLGTRVFDWSGTKAESKKADNVEATAFLNNLHGTALTNAVPISFAYLLAAFATFIAFGMLSMGIVGAKLALYVVTIVVYLILLAMIVPGVNTGEKLRQFVKVVLSLSAVSVMAMILLAIMMMVSNALIGMGAMFLKPGTFMSVLWAGISPLVSMLVTNILFKKIFKMPSVFTPSGALAWAGSAAGVGATAFAGASVGSNMFTRAIRRQMYRGERRLMNTGMSKLKDAFGGHDPESGALEPMGEKAKPRGSWRKGENAARSLKGTGAPGADKAGGIPGERTVGTPTAKGNTEMGETTSGKPITPEKLAAQNLGMTPHDPTDESVLDGGRVEGESAKDWRKRIKDASNAVKDEADPNSLGAKARRFQKLREEQKNAPRIEGGSKLGVGALAAKAIAGEGTKLQQLKNVASTAPQLAGAAWKGLGTGLKLARKGTGIALRVTGKTAIGSLAFGPIGAVAMGAGQLHKEFTKIKDRAPSLPDLENASALFRAQIGIGGSAPTGSGGSGSEAPPATGAPQGGGSGGGGSRLVSDEGRRASVEAAIKGGVDTKGLVPIGQPSKGEWAEPKSSDKKKPAAVNDEARTPALQAKAPTPDTEGKTDGDKPDTKSAPDVAPMGEKYEAPEGLEHGLPIRKEGAPASGLESDSEKKISLDESKDLTTQERPVLQTRTFTPEEKQAIQQAGSLPTATPRVNTKRATAPKRAISRTMRLAANRPTRPTPPVAPMESTVKPSTDTPKGFDAPKILTEPIERPPHV